jgi:hypothetical protein
MIDPIILAIVNLANGKQNRKAELHAVLPWWTLIWKILGTKNIAQRIGDAMKVAC